jgi:hypothetical protein
MRALPILFLAAVPTALAQNYDPTDAVDQALAATTDLAVFSAQTGDPLTAEAALRAHDALANVAEALRASPYYQVPSLMDPVTFRTFYDELRRAMSSDRHAYIRRSGRRHLFTVDQVASLMKLFVMADDQIRVALTLYRHLVDPENFDRAYASLTFATDRRRLALAVAR